MAKLESSNAPHIRHSENTRLVMADVILTMSIIYGMSVYYFGLRPLMLLAVSLTSALIMDLICLLVARKQVNPRDLSAVITGMIIPLIMPVSIAYWIVAVAAIFGILVAKHPFGGVGNNVFNPAAAGFCFVTISFSSQIFTYPMPMEHLPLFGDITTISGISPAYTLELGGIPKYDIVAMALGNFPGPMGATNIVVILTCLLFLVSRNTVRWVTPLCFIATCAAFAFLFPRIGVAEEMDFFTRLQSVAYELMSGFLLFGGVFMLGDPVTAPKRQWSKIAWAITAGIMVMMFRRFGNFEEEFPFALLLMNATVWGFDMLGEDVAKKVRRKSLESHSGNTLQAQSPSA